MLQMKKNAILNIVQQIPMKRGGFLSFSKFYKFALGLYLFLKGLKHRVP